MPFEPKDIETSIARINAELDHIKDGLRLLGLKQCSCCNKFFLSQDGKTLFDAGQLVCYDCLQQCWQQRSPELSVEQRLAIEHKLLRWLVAYHKGKVIRHAESMPPAAAIELKMVVACEQCAGTGQSLGGACHNCAGRGNVWVITLRPELQ